jgi:hypothetical protein
MLIWKENIIFKLNKFVVYTSDKEEVREAVKHLKHNKSSEEDVILAKLLQIMYFSMRKAKSLHGTARSGTGP